MRPLAAVALVLAFAVPASADLPEVQKRGTLRVLASSDETPEMFDFKAGPNPGFEREIVEGFAKLHRLKLEVVPVAVWETILPSLVEGKGDVVIGLIDTPLRRRTIDFTSEILPARHLAVSRKPAPVIDTLEALRARRVAVIPGSSWEEEAKKAGVPAAKLVGLPDTQGVLAGMRDGKADAAVMSLSDFTLAARRDPALQAGVFVGAAASAAWGVRKGDVQLKRALDEYLESLRRTPSWSRLVVKYFGEQALTVLGRARK